MTSVAETSRASRTRLRALLEGRRSGWTVPLLVWAASRVVSTLLLATVFVVATANGWDFASHRRDPSFFTFSGSWDASFYRIIAERGYPATLPTDDDGHVLPNAWAFLPVFPWLVRAVMSVTGGSFWVVGVLVASVAGAFACVLLYRLVLAVGCSHRARWATALFAFGPTGFLLQVAYAESTFLVLVFGGLLALVRRRYWLVGVLGVVGAFTKPGILALAVALAVHLVMRWVAAVRAGRAGAGAAAAVGAVGATGAAGAAGAGAFGAVGAGAGAAGAVGAGRAFPWRDRIAIVVSGLAIAVAGLAWPVVASGVTGRPNAYLDTELSWWVGFVGRQHFAPLTPWFTMAGTWLGPLGIVLVVAVLGGAVWFWCRRDVRALGVDVLAFTASYALYLVAVFLPQQSLPRLLMPVAPLLGSDVFVRTRRRAAVWLVVGVALQAVAVVLLWFLGYP